jgi:hypothetical protein
VALGAGGRLLGDCRAGECRADDNDQDRNKGGFDMSIHEVIPFLCV